jgi:hypothetical protein
MRKFKDGYLDLGDGQLSSKKFIIRAIYVSLLVIGISALIFSFDVVNKELLLSEDSLKSVKQYNVEIEYVNDVYFGLITPIL